MGDDQEQTDELRRYCEMQYILADKHQTAQFELFLNLLEAGQRCATNCWIFGLLMLIAEIAFIIVLVRHDLNEISDRFEEFTNSSTMLYMLLNNTRL